MGLTFMADTAYLLPLTLVFLTISVGGLVFRASQRRGIGPFALGTLAGVLLLLGKFAVDSEMLAYAGIALLIAASLWKTWPTRKLSGVKGAPPETLHQIGSRRKEP
jgi:hypothetical protein